jgi:putative molybdenum carrier protein
MDINATVILSPGDLTGGTLLTLVLCRQHGKPVLVINATKTAESDAAAKIAQIVEERSVSVLNVAGPRARGWLHAHEYARHTICALLGLLKTA